MRITLKALKFIGLTITGLIGFVLIYMLFAYSLARITMAGEKNNKREVAIFIKTNGVHTDIVVPVQNELMDWDNFVRISDTKSTDTSFKYLGMGWGDKGFYLETPTWADLKFSVAFKAATGLSTTAIHATFYAELTEDSTCRQIWISESQYNRLIDYICNSFQHKSDGSFIQIETDANYGLTDAFYEAKGRYSMLHTCNTWTNLALKACGQKHCFWTPFDTGIFFNYN